LLFNFPFEDRRLLTFWSEVATAELVPGTEIDTEQKRVKALQTRINSSLTGKAQGGIFHLDSVSIHVLAIVLPKCSSEYCGKKYFYETWILKLSDRRNAPCLMSYVGLPACLSG
jgi:hypothetical protein